ncbi:MAG TPA: sulfotransferase domain-containing protein [Candidatus Nanoarchaeia archaeon]|nr:sulfotransferase domain-containing protein [Candidatus Nanoarchaeia archaeon]
MIPISQLLYGLKKYKLKSIISNIFSIYVSDYVIVSFQKCGKTWLRMMLSRVLSEKFNIKKIMLDLQYMTLFKKGAPNILISHGGSIKDNNNINFQKIFKNKKIIFLVRDPRDIVVSLYHGSRTRDKTYDGGNISTFIGDGNSGFSKIINFMNAWANDLQNRNRDNYIIIKYENLKKDAARELRRIFNFMELDIEDHYLHEAVNYGSFDNMRKLEVQQEIKDYRMLPGNLNDPNSFRTRKGKIGSHKEELSIEDIGYINQEMLNLNPFFGYLANEN